MTSPSRLAGGRTRRLQTNSRAGNPIRRPPNSGSSISSAGSLSGEQENHFLPTINNSTNNYNAPERSRQQLARTLLAVACLWPLLFLIIPPPAPDPSHMAILSAGTDTMISYDDNNPNKSLSAKFQSIEKRAHDKIDKVRAITTRNLAAKTEFLQHEMKNLLHRKDVVGYGKDRPRVAVVVVIPQPTKVEGGEGTEDDLEMRILNGAIDAVQSVFSTTDRNRIFIVTVVMDGRGKIGTFAAKLQDIDAGRTRHRHGEEMHTHDHHPADWKKHDHEEEGKDEEEEHYHSEKIYTIYNHEVKGVSRSRKDAVHFINVLSKKHEQAGLKAPNEDLILLFLRCDSRLREHNDNNRTWLDDVTDALIIPSTDENEDIMSKLSTGTEKDKKPKQHTPMQASNAVSFVVDSSSTDTEGNVEIHSSHVGETLSFDQCLRPRPSSATGEQMALSNGESYPTPLTQVATALRLRTYNAFPANDEALTSHFSADVELSFNLWMCGDGIDVLPNSRVVVSPGILPAPSLSPPLAGRIVSAWMSGHGDDVYANNILHCIAKRSAQESILNREKSGLQLKDHSMSETKILAEKTKQLNDMLVRISSEAKASSSFPSGLSQKCRPFSWYAQNVHPQNDFHEGGDQDDAKKQAWMGEAIKQDSDAKIVPSKPLDAERMAIISKATPVNIKYVDLSGGHVDHPHKGGMDENGNFGYVHDETFLIKNPPHFQIKDDNDRSVLCKKGDPNYQMLTKKVFVDLPNHEAAAKRAEHGLSKERRAKIFCLVYTIEKNHGSIPAIKETWG